MDTSLHLIPPMGEVISLTGDKMRGAGWYGHTTGLHSVAIRVLKSLPRTDCKVQATIAIAPTEDDWYSVLPGESVYLQYPQPSYRFPPGGFGGETSTLGFNFCHQRRLVAGDRRS